MNSVSGIKIYEVLIGERRKNFTDPLNTRGYKAVARYFFPASDINDFYTINSDIKHLVISCKEVPSSPSPLKGLMRQYSIQHDKLYESLTSVLQAFPNPLISRKDIPVLDAAIHGYSEASRKAKLRTNIYIGAKVFVCLIASALAWIAYCYVFLLGKLQVIHREELEDWNHRGVEYEFNSITMLEISTCLQTGIPLFIGLLIFLLFNWTGIRYRTGTVEDTDRVVFYRWCECLFRELRWRVLNPNE